MIPHPRERTRHPLLQQQQQVWAHKALRLLRH
jgi:hypothetical protein